MAGLAGNRGEERTVAIDATYPKAHRTATGLGVEKGGAVARSSHRGRHERQVARHSADSQGRPPGPFVTAVEVGDCIGYIGAWALPNSPPKVARGGYDADRFGFVDSFIDNGIAMGSDDVRRVSRIAVIVAASRSTSDYTQPKASTLIIHASGGGLRGRMTPRKPPIWHETVAN